MKKAVNPAPRFLVFTEGDFEPNNHYEELAIPIKDLVRYPWNNQTDQEAIIEEALEDIQTVYKDRILPEEPEDEKIQVFNELIG